MPSDPLGLPEPGDKSQQDQSALQTDPMRMGLVISTAVGIVGITFGVLAQSAGLSLWQAMAMSIFVFTGASQFAAVSVVSAGGTMGAAIGTAVLLAARNTLYGPVVGQWVDGPVIKRLGIAHLIIDESTGVGAAQHDKKSARRGFLITGIGVFVAWNIGTAIGVLSGDFIGDPAQFGLDVAFPASFLALLAPHLKNPEGRVTALVGAAIVIAATSFAPVGFPVLLAAVGVIPGIMVLRRATLARSSGEVEQ